jgi:hypothetical protein
MQKEKLKRPTLAVANTTAIDGALPAEATSDRNMRTPITKAITNSKKGGGGNGRSINDPRAQQAKRVGRKESRSS